MQNNIAKNILDEELIDRESDIYTLFEDKIKDLTQTNGKDDKDKIKANFEEIAYLFSQQCFYRDKVQRDNQFLKQDMPWGEDLDKEFYHDIYLGHYILSSAAENIKENLKRLSELDKDLFLYFWSLTDYIYKNETHVKKYKAEDFTALKILNLISKEELKKAIGSQRAKEVFDMYGEFSLALELEDFICYLTEEERKQLTWELKKNHYRKFNTNMKTYIMDNRPSLYEYQSSVKTALVEIDLTKPKKQILEYIEYIIETYNKDKNSFYLMHELLETPNQIYKESMTGFLKTNKRLPLCVNLTDYLFIYDCNKAFISIRNTFYTLNCYYDIVYEIGNKTDRKSTVENHLKAIKNYIDEKKYMYYYNIELLNVEPSIDHIIDEAENIYFSPKYS